MVALTRIGTSGTLYQRDCSRSADSQYLAVTAQESNLFRCLFDGIREWVLSTFHDRV
jgi:hypothetical protein